MASKTYDITPVAKPRMTRSDKWKKRPATAKYWAFKDEVKRLGIQVPESGAHVTFHMPVPGCGKDRVGKPHQQVPDVDNLVKALLDAIYEDDAHIWDIRATKLWSDKGMIEVL